jgi:hypothetical protein
MSKGNDKKPKADKTKPKASVSPYSQRRVRPNRRSVRPPKSPGGSRLACEGKFLGAIRRAS